ncbi:M48 family metallopeptidase [Sporocytophaga myxococcoides]|uniref:M48 family metallopeptidase n=1 Tax=Sporocytophaga myxococcoides TaxID=153721 RepID=UPI001FDF8220|nr:M48 family metallopeptidase [Sporocytophaga myxococcoides]
MKMRLMKMLNKGKLILLSLAIAIGCSKVPVTGRKQLDIVPNSQVLALAKSEYNEFLKTNKVVNNTSQAEEVEKVGRNIANAVEAYLKKEKQTKLLEGYNWQFNLVEDPQINAWCMPGGKVVVFTGIMPITQSEAGLATVMGHEIAHAVARHGNERMSQGLTAQLGGVALDVALSSKPDQTRNLFMAAYGVGANVGILLPYSRLQESEADRIGLIFMSMAGYDPAEAINFWERMEKASQGGEPPEFLSTHPSHKTRIEELKKQLPEALKYYNQAVSKR